MATAKTFLVTGAGRDIGQAIARQLGGPDTFGIIHCASSRAGADATLRSLREAGGEGIVITADFADDTSVTRFLVETEQVLAEQGLDVLVLNAAATAATSPGVSLEMLHAMLAVNVLAPHRLLSALAPRLTDGGAVVALSIAAVRQVFSPEFAFFSATKAATDVLVKGWAVALGSRRIRVNAVAPGVVDANFRADLLKDEGFRAALESATALRRPGRIDDVADVVAFLASDKARWITGQVIDASGGWRL